MVDPIVRRRVLLRAACLDVLLLCCGACSQGEYGPLGSPSYLPPDSVTGAGGSGATGGEVGSAPAGGGGGANLLTAGSSGSNAMSSAGGPSGGAGNAGSPGGGAPCAPIPAKSSWRITVSSSGATTPSSNLNDDNLSDRWSTGKPQVGNEWLEIDFGLDVALTQATLVLGTSMNDYPRSYEVRFSDVAMSTGPALLTGSGSIGMDAVLTFPAPRTGRYLRITQTGTSANSYWSAAELQVQCQE